MTTYSSSGVPELDLTAPLRTDRDVILRVDALVDQSSRRRRSLWLFFLSGDGIQLPVVVPIDDVPERPDAVTVGNLCDVIAQVLAEAAPTGSAVVALTRPGAETINENDRCWFRVLHRYASDRGANIRLLCLATPARVRQLVLDEADRPPSSSAAAASAK
jgi:hypothetical protein